MTKRRPSWSDSLRRAAALACSLLLWQVSSAVWAASKTPSAKSPAGKVIKKAVNKPVKATGKGAPPKSSVLPAIGPAEILDADTVGLHGHASFYGHGFQGRKTATGEAFDVRQFTGASNHFPLGSMVAVHRLDSDLCAIVKVNDRMHVKHRRRVIDVSRGVAEYLQMLSAGVVLVRVAPLRKGAEGQGADVCRAAFEPEVECASCGRPPRLPDFDQVAGD